MIRPPHFALLAASSLTLATAFVACDVGPGAGIAAPTNLTANPMAGGVHLVWNDNSDGEIGFEVERRTTSEFAKVTTVAFDTNQFHDETVAAGTAYVYRVRAIIDAESSAYSNEAAVTTPGSSDANGAAAGPDAGSDAGAELTDAGVDAGEPQVSFRTQVVPILVQSCGAGNSSCHSRAAYAANKNMDCRGWLALEDASLGSVVYAGPTAGSATGCPDRTLHQRLGDLAAWMCTPITQYVVAGQPDQSLIYTVLGSNPGMDGACKDGANMPLARMPKALAPLPAADIALIKTWIEQGAKDN